MFPASEFLIYCFVTAYTPGANNLLSMTNAAVWDFGKVFALIWELQWDS